LCADVPGSHELALQTDSGYLDAADGFYMAMATQTNSDAIVSSVESQGLLNGGYSTADWFINGVPSSAKSEWASVVSGFYDIQSSVLGAAVATTTTATGATTASVTSGATTATSAASGSKASSGSAASATSSSTAGAQAPRVTGGAVAGLAAVVAVGAAVLM
jgi:hypothetical protein